MSHKAQSRLIDSPLGPNSDSPPILRNESLVLFPTIKFPVPVEIAFNIFNLSAIDNVSGFFHVDFLLIVSWPDSAPELSSEEEQIIQNTKKIWTPQLWIKNSIDLEEITLANPFTAKAGMVTWKNRYKGTCSAGEMDLQHFPFDDHILSVIICSGFAAERLFFVESPTRTNILGIASLPDWILKEVTWGIKTTDTAASSSNQSYSEFHLQFDVHRKPEYYLWNIVLTMTFIVSMSWIVFSIDVESLADRINILVALFLAAGTFLNSLPQKVPYIIVAYKSAVADKLPRISYNTTLDKFLIANLTSLWALAIESWLANMIQSHFSIYWGEQFDLIFVPLFFIGFVLSAYVFLWDVKPETHHQRQSSELRSEGGSFRSLSNHRKTQ